MKNNFLRNLLVIGFLGAIIFGFIIFLFALKTEEVKVSESNSTALIKSENIKIHNTGKVHVLKLDNRGYAGQFIVLESGGKFAVIDAGAVDLTESESVVYPYLENLGVKEFEFVIITHFDEDHFSYLTDSTYGNTRYADKQGALLEKYGVKRVIVKDPQDDYARYPKDDYLRLKNSLAKRGILVEWTTEISFGGLDLNIMNNHQTSEKEIEHQKNIIKTDVANMDSISVLVQNGSHKMFVGGDMEKFDEEDMLRSGEVDKARNSEVFVMNHHGNVGSNTEEFRRAINPKVAILTAGEDFLNGAVIGQKEFNEKLRSEYGKNNVLFTQKGTVVVEFSDSLNVYQKVGSESIEIYKN